MPNWCHNELTITGNKEKTREFLKLGLKTNNLPERTVEIEEIISNLSNDKKLSIGKFYPMPEIFKTDTTNHPEQFPEIAEEQKRLYGVVGWYDWCITYWGTKWDADFDDVQYVENDETGIIMIYFESAWSPPVNWLEYVQENVAPDLDFEMYYEEPGMGFAGTSGTYRDEEGNVSISDVEIPWEESKCYIEMKENGYEDEE